VGSSLCSLGIFVDFFVADLMHQPLNEQITKYSLNPIRFWSVEEEILERRNLFRNLLIATLSTLC
jgi:hypothetical protein